MINRREAFDLLSGWQHDHRLLRFDVKSPLIHLTGSGFIAGLSENRIVIVLDDTGISDNPAASLSFEFREPEFQYSDIREVHEVEVDVICGLAISEPLIGLEVVVLPVTDEAQKD
jgi:hypothetical protein